MCPTSSLLSLTIVSGSTGLVIGLPYIEFINKLITICAGFYVSFSIWVVDYTNIQ